MTFISLSILCGLIAGILLLIEVGQRISNFHQISGRREGRMTSGAAEASTFALMGLLIALTFYGAASRFDMRRNLIAEEANAIGTAYLRLDLLPPETQPRLRENFRRYVQSRLAAYKQFPDAVAVKAALDRSSTIQRDIWNEAMDAMKASGPAEKSLVTVSLNEMIDITTIRTVALMSHPPVAVFAMLGLTVIASST